MALALILSGLTPVKQLIQKQQNHTYGYQGNPSKVLPKGIVTVQRVHACCVKRCADQQAGDSWDSLIWPNWALVFIGVIASVVGIGTVKATRRAAEAAKNSADALMDSERSWLLVHTTGQPEPHWPHMVKDGYIPGIRIRFKVFGKTPIHLKEVGVKICFVPRIPETYPPQPELPPVADYGDIPADAACVGQNGTLPPDAFLDIHRNVDKGSLSSERIASVVRREQMMCALGSLKYTDNFGRQKETRVCYVHDFESEVPDIIGGEEVFAPAGFRKAGTEAYNKAT